MSKEIKLVVFDFDGVFTDGTITIDNNGYVIKKYNVKDGMGINLLKKKNKKGGGISGYKEKKLKLNNLKHLKINYRALGIKNKQKILNNWCSKLDINIKSNVAYMGDDINDINVLNNVAFSGCPMDAHKECLSIVDFISTKNGGNGCIREFCDEIIKNNNELTNTNI